LALGFGWAILDLAGAAYERGDVYPPWSSLRADAAGTKLLHDSLRKLAGWRVERHFGPDTKIPAAPGAVLFLRQEPRELKSLTKTVERLAAGGARVVVGVPEQRLRLRKGQKTETEAVEWLGLRFEPHSAGSYEGERFAETTRWEFVGKDPAWKVAGTQAERALGQGSVVLFPGEELQNEALREGPDGKRLLRLLGPGRRVMFVESALGVSEKGGIVSLMRRAGWGPAVLLLLVATALYLWRSLTPVLPEREDAVTREEPGGGAAAMAQLLRKHVAPRELLATCHSEWKRAAGVLPRWQRQRPLPAATDDPVEAYRRMQECVREKPSL
jgi:hypothetical protein